MKAKKHIILNHIAESKGLRRKDVVVLDGYYGTNFQNWAYEGYIVKKGNKWYIGTLGKLYLRNPQKALLKARVKHLTNLKHLWRDRYRNLQKESNAQRIASRSLLQNAHKELEELKPKRNTLTLQPPPTCEEMKAENLKRGEGAWETCSTPSTE